MRAIAPLRSTRSRRRRRTTRKRSLSGPRMTPSGRTSCSGSAGLYAIAAMNGASRRLEEARDALLAAGDPERRRRRRHPLAQLLWYRGAAATPAYAHLDAAEELVDGAGPSLGESARARVVCALRLLARRPREVIWDRKGGARDRGGTGARRASCARADDHRVGEDVARRRHRAATSSSVRSRSRSRPTRPLASNVLNNLPSKLTRGDLRRAQALYREGSARPSASATAKALRFVRREPHRGPTSSAGAGTRRSTIADASSPSARRSPHYIEVDAARFRGYIRLARGDSGGGARGLRARVSRSLARPMDPQTVAPALLHVGVAASSQLGRIDEARGGLGGAGIRSEHPTRRAPWQIARSRCSELGTPRGDAARSSSRRPTSPWRERRRSLWLDGRLRSARAKIYAEVGVLPVEAEARLRAAEAADRRRSPRGGRGRAREGARFYRSVGATFYVERGEALLATDGTDDRARRERKVVTVVFCDLVGFTSRRRRWTRRTLRRFFARTTSAFAPSSSATAARSRSSSATP